MTSLPVTISVAWITLISSNKNKENKLEFRFNKNSRQQRFYGALRAVQQRHYRVWAGSVLNESTSCKSHAVYKNVHNC
jgi:hypothetical protein